MCEKRQWYTCPVSFEVTSKAPTNVLIAPAFASIGGFVALLSCSFDTVVTVVLFGRPGLQPRHNLFRTKGL
jgi:hypothetical protein